VWVAVGHLADDERSLGESYEGDGELPGHGLKIIELGGGGAAGDNGEGEDLAVAAELVVPETAPGALAACLLGRKLRVAAGCALLAEQVVSGVYRIPSAGQRCVCQRTSFPFRLSLCSGSCGA